MRAGWQEALIAGAEGFFSPFHAAIDVNTDADRVREPWWHAVRFDHNRLLVLERLLNIIKLDYRLFTYRLMRPRKPPVIRSWLPGYFFVEFDDRDAWRQLNLVPGVFEVLSTRLETAVVEDLVDRLPRYLVATPVAECESIAQGTVVRVINGTLRGYAAPVIWSERKRVKIMTMMFERPIEVELRTRDVEVIS